MERRHGGAAPRRVRWKIFLLILFRSMKLIMGWLAIFTIISLDGTIALGDSQKRGTLEITYGEPSREKTHDLAPLPAGGIAALVSHLYYPRDLRYRSHFVQGATHMIVRVDKDGRVTSVTFKPHMHSELEEVALGAVHACRWIPAKRHGVSANGAVNIPIDFSMREK
ncbi:MAG: hypothetical protein DMF10_06365 [Verrucomicrobia bacterium]|nr:MAG: hypothetical protein DMF10_06365 [Verrucomicrobiota bacterium]